MPGGSTLRRGMFLLTKALHRSSAISVLGPSSGQLESLLLRIFSLVVPLLVPLVLGRVDMVKKRLASRIPRDCADLGEERLLLLVILPDVRSPPQSWMMPCGLASCLGTLAPWNNACGQCSAHVL